METPESPLRLSGSPEFLVVCAEGAREIEYHLLRAEDNKKVREFRAEFQLLGYGSHVALGGTRKSKVPFTGEELVAGKFRLKLRELAKGEFAFLPPTKGVNGKLYTFALR